MIGKEAGNNGNKDSGGNLRKVNVVTKLPTLNNDSGSKAQMLEQQEQQPLAFGPDFFVMHQARDFVAKNVVLAPTFPAKKSIPNSNPREHSEQVSPTIAASIQRNISQASFDSAEVT